MNYRFVPVFVIACAILSGGGCSGEKIVELKEASQFQSEVIAANKPVLVFFWKGGCASCGALAPTIDKLASEYDGRVKVVSYMLMSLTFMVQSQELRDRYDVVIYPTVVLVVDGQEKKKWVADYNIAHYRAELDKYVSAKSPGNP